MIDLEPCPFCGGEAEIWRANGERTAWIACMGKCSVLVSKEYKTDEEAIAAWNRRTAHARIEAQAALIAELTEAAETLADCYVGNVDAYRTAGFYQNPEKEAEVVELRAVISKAKEAQK